MMKRLRTKARTAVQLTLLAACLFLGASRSESAEKKVLDFSPGDAGQLFTIPKSMWSDINEFAFLLCVDEPEANTMLRTQARRLPGYNEFDAACRVWAQTTFPALQKLAAELARRDIKELLLRLQTSLQKWSANPGAGRAEFDQTAETLNRRLLELSELSAQVNAQWMSLYDVSNAVITEYHRNYPPQPFYIRIGPKLVDVKLAVGSMVGRWNLLTSNLAFLRKTLALPTGGAGIPDLYDLDIDVGMAAWDEIAQRGEVFLADVRQHENYLTGENYYEGCPADEKTWYVLKLPYTGFVVTAQPAGSALPASLAMAQQVLEGHPDRWGRATTIWRQQWRFTRLGKGWLSIENRSNTAAAPANRLLIDNTPALAVAPVSSLPAGKQFWWRCLPIHSVSGTNWFRLINAALGEMRSLDIEGKGAVMSTSSGLNGQWFSLQPALTE